MQFSWQGKTHFVGYYADEYEAGLAYNEAILPVAGAFARLNDVPGRTEPVTPRGNP